MSAVDSSGPTRRSASSSSGSNGTGSVSRPNVSQNQPSSTAARCLTKPRRVVYDVTGQQAAAGGDDPSVPRRDRGQRADDDPGRPLGGVVDMGKEVRTSGGTAQIGDPADRQE